MTIDDATVNHLKCSPIGESVSKSNAAINEEFLFIHRDELTKAKSAIIQIRRMPASVGMAKLEEANVEPFDQSQLRTIVANTPGSWTWRFQGNVWFLFEDRENALVNQLAKAFSTGQYCEIERLSATMVNAFRSRAKGKLPFPPLEVVREYIRNSKLTEVKNEVVSFNGDLAALNPIEQDVVSFLSQVEFTDSRTLRDYLRTKNYGEAHIIKAVYNSPLVHVDKSMGRKQYRYSLVCQSEPPVLEPRDRDRHEEYVSKLKDVARLGTDSEVETTRRREQALLREWLFGENETECCAICGREFEVRALHAAHKKKRTLCSEAERTDPNIVMPICVFGCDFLYENRCIRITNGEIIEGDQEPCSPTSAGVVADLLGRSINERWMAGHESYFDAETD
ncbi:hypothetical protein [Planctomycetes bacterium TBK1r]|uniref:C2H2-type domain-containing protein n=1 Tax=Stieleria magnilauensis TaxID=2527963 RepID=A0ABX5XTX8_9BACT|nr:hypothetical protein TBK1r_44970 [Planctomycetes bacterium TBK1r]